MSVTYVTSKGAPARRNAYQLSGKSERDGYDWWWHSLVGVHRPSGRERPFFIEYYVVNPGLSGPVLEPQAASVPRAGAEARLGDGQGQRPSYALIKAGAWSLGPGVACPLSPGHDEPVQIDNCWPIKDFRASRDRLEVLVGPNSLSETSLRGAAFVGGRLPGAGLWPSAGPEGLDAVLPGPGIMTWELKASKDRAYSVGYGASRLFSRLRLFRMYWHVAGMRTRFSGTITLDGEVYDVFPEQSAGYQDKNWGSDYTNPWIWLNCNRFRPEGGGEACDTSLDLGGGRPVLAGLALERRILVALWHRGRLEEFNFSHFWRRGRQEFQVENGTDALRWRVTAENARTRVEIDFSCPKAGMIKVDYENPAGYRHHRELWNGGWASGTLRIWRRRRRGEAGEGAWVLSETLEGSHGGCEYGEY